MAMQITLSGATTEGTAYVSLLGPRVNQISDFAYNYMTGDYSNPYVIAIPIPALGPLTAIAGPEGVTVAPAAGGAGGMLAAFPVLAMLGYAIWRYRKRKVAMDRKRDLQKKIDKLRAAELVLMQAQLTPKGAEAKAVELLKEAIKRSVEQKRPLDGKNGTATEVLAEYGLGAVLPAAEASLSAPGAEAVVMLAKAPLAPKVRIKEELMLGPEFKEPAASPLPEWKSLIQAAYE